MLDWVGDANAERLTPQPSATSAVPVGVPELPELSDVLVPVPVCDTSTAAVLSAPASSNANTPSASAMLVVFPVTLVTPVGDDAEVEKHATRPNPDGVEAVDPFCE